jgi:uroporphyrinogen III methyltransferase/synthase
MNTGKVWLVGAGPSDVGLLTLNAKSVLEEAESVLYDSLVGDSILALIPPNAKKINVGKRAGHAVMAQEDINKALLSEAQAGRKVVRLKGGDPFLFGRGGEELEQLVESGIPFEIVPGVTSAVAVPAYAGIPVTHRDFCSSVHIITGHLKDGDKLRIDFDALVRLRGTLIFLMGIGALGFICESLIKAGMSPNTPAAVLEKGTTAAQRRVVSTVGRLPADAAAQQIKTPAIIVVGEVCSLAEKFHWAEDRPLGGVRVLVTRPAELKSSLSRQLRERGAEVVELPAIKTAAIRNNPAFDNALDRLSDYQWVVFTSQVGVRIFFDRLLERKIDVRRLNSLKFAAIGSATEKALYDRGILADCVPETYDSEHLGQALVQMTAPGERFLIPRARIGSPELIQTLDEAHIPYDDIPVYDTIYETGGILTPSALVANCSETYVAFTSASTVQGFAAMAKDMDLSTVTAVCIGTQTAKEAAGLGMRAIISDTITIDSLADKITELHKAVKEGL